MAAGPRTGGPGPAPALAARLEKRIPVAAGLAGGSSDAAATIDAALEAWGAELDPDARLRLAAQLGSDVPFFGAGGPALVEGPRRAGRAAPRAPRVAGRAARDAGRPGLDARRLRGLRGSRGVGDGSVRMSSVHLAEELRSGLSAADLVARAGVLAMANDLLPATAALLPELVTFRRALNRRLGRPLGLSGSGPTLWALYASEPEAAAAADSVRAALLDGTLSAPGEADPFVTATTIVTHPPAEEPTT